MLGTLVMRDSGTLVPTIGPRPIVIPWINFIKIEHVVQSEGTTFEKLFRVEKFRMCILVKRDMCTGLFLLCKIRGFMCDYKSFNIGDLEDRKLL